MAAQRRIGFVAATSGKRGHRRLKSWMNSCALAACALAVTSPARADILDFEEPPVGTLTDFYLGRGAYFNAPQLLSYSATAGFAHSGSKAIEVCFAQEFCTASLRITFNAEQGYARLWVGSSLPLPEARTVVLQAWDANGVLITLSTAVLVASAQPTPVQTPLEVSSASRNIKQVVLAFEPTPGGPAANVGLVVDDIEYLDGPGLPAPCAATSPPTLDLESPHNNEVVHIDQFRLQGTWTSEVPLVQATVVVYQPSGVRHVDVLGSFGSFSPTGVPFGTEIAGVLAVGSQRVDLYLRNCRGAVSVSRSVDFLPIDPGTRFKFLGLDVVQSTQDPGNRVPLVSNKSTMVRVYLSTDGPAASIDGISGSLIATPPAGQPIPPLLYSTNSISVSNSSGLGSKRLDLAASLNFMLPREWTDGRTLHFELEKLYVQGRELDLPCDGCANLDEIGAPRWAHFNATKPLNLVLAPYVYSNGKVPDVLFTTMGALQWLNNVYPLSGNFPMDGSGVKIARILPMNTTDKTLGPRNDAGGEFLDELNAQLFWLKVYSGQELPDDYHLLAMTPCGCSGRADTDGRVAWVGTHSVDDGPVAPSRFSGYGQNWSHEIAHNIGREHAGNAHGEDVDSILLDIWEFFAGETNYDTNFPYEHGEIAVPGLALNTEWWHPPSLSAPYLIPPETNGRHAHDFMSYGGAPHWISPYTYEALFDHFLANSQARSAAPPGPSEKVVVAGRIDPDGSVTLRPFYRVETGYGTEGEADGKFSIELVDSAGRTLAAHRFSPRKREGSAGRSFSEVVPWAARTSRIVVKGAGRTLASRDVSRNAPIVRILDPNSSGARGSEVTVGWKAVDPDGDPLTFAVLYRAGPKSAWTPVAEGLTKDSFRLDGRLLPGGERASLRVVATDGVNTSMVETGPLKVADKPPLVAIHVPREGDSVQRGASIQIAGMAWDAEDGQLSDERLEWTSDRDGRLGYGRALEAKSLSRGKHVLTLTASDSSHQSAESSITIEVVTERPDLKRQ